MIEGGGLERGGERGGEGGDEERKGVMGTPWY